MPVVNKGKPAARGATGRWSKTGKAGVGSDILREKRRPNSEAPVAPGNPAGAKPSQKRASQGGKDKAAQPVSLIDATNFPPAA